MKKTSSLGFRPSDSMSLLSQHVFSVASVPLATLRERV
jgi:hypothetical protein